MKASRDSNDTSVLTDRERQIAGLYARGDDHRAIAESLFLAPTTVRTHLQNIYRKLAVSNKIALARALAESPDAPDAPEAKIGLEDQSDIRFATSRDGARIAYAAVGSGPPLIMAGSWLTHLTLSWHPYHLESGRLSGLAERFRLIRYDQRGSGLSEWKAEIAFDRMVDDLEAVIDAQRHDKVALYGRSQGAAVSIAYAARHPGKVTHLILHGAYARGRRRRGDPGEQAMSEAMVAMIREGWGARNPAFRQIMTTLFAEATTAEEIDHFNEFQRRSGPAETVARYREIFDDIDVLSLAASVAAPTLLLHSRGDAIAPLEEVKLLAATIPGARLVLFDSAAHVLRPDDPAFPKLVAMMEDFVATRR